MQDTERVLSFDFEGGLDAASAAAATTNPAGASGPLIQSDPSAAAAAAANPVAAGATVAADPSVPGANPANRRSFRQTVCRHWLRSLCMKGDACGFLHQYDKSRMPVCRFFRVYGECREQDCVYKHTNEDIKECNILANTFEKDRATGVEAQTSVEMIEDLNMESEQDHISDALSVNQELNFQPAISSQNIGRKRNKQKNDIVQGFSEVVTQIFNNLAERFDKSEANYPKYLAEELKRLGFNYRDNLKISKAMRSDPSNVEVFKIITTDEEKINFAKTFMEM